jgi:uncharacterized protein YndB with AHSA1/START domain
MAVKNNSNKDLLITRVFDAPLEIVWKAWTEAEQLKKWWGPKTFTAPVINNDLRVGGKYLYCMRGPDGKDYWSTGVYKEIIPLRKIVATDSFADEKGNIVSASQYGMGNDFPLEVLLTVTFEDINGKTKLTIIHSDLPAGDMKEMTGLGWNESLDKFERAVEVIKQDV